MRILKINDEIITDEFTLKLLINDKKIALKYCL